MRKYGPVLFGALLLPSAVALTTPIAAQTTAPAPAAAPAPSVEAMQAANELFSMMSKDMMDQIVHQVTASVWPMIEQRLTAKADAATIAQLRQEFERIQMDNLKEVMQGAPAIYARHFSAAELRELLAFNRSAVGQKALREMPQIMGEITAMLVPRMRDIEARTEEAFKKVAHEHGIDL